MPKVPKITSLQYLCNISRKMWKMRLTDKRQRFLQIDTVIFKKSDQACPNYSNQSWFAIPLQYLKEDVSDEVDCFRQTSIKVSYKLILWFWWGCSSISKVPEVVSLECLCNISKRNVEIKLIFVHADKHQSFLQVGFNTFVRQSSLQSDTIIDEHDQAFSELSK